MDSSTLNQRQFNLRFILAMVAFLLTLVIQTFSIELLQLSPSLVITMALLPTLPLLWSFFIFRRYYLNLDEYLQRLSGEAFLWTLGIVCFLSFGYGMLTMKLTLPQINLAYLLPAVFGGHVLILQLLLLGHGREE